MDTPEDTPCAECKHPLRDHGDRALRACVDWLPPAFKGGRPVPGYCGCKGFTTHQHPEPASVSPEIDPLAVAP